MQDVMLNSVNPYKANERGLQDRGLWKLWESGVTMQMVLVSKQKNISKKLVCTRIECILSFSTIIFQYLI